MDINDNWNDFNQQQDDDLSSMLQPKSLAKLSSRHPLEKIKKNLFANIIFAGIICLLYVMVLVYFNIWQVRVTLGLVLIFSLWAMYTAFRQYQQINTGVSATNSLLSELKRHHLSISRWMLTQQRVALFFYPVSASAGFMLGGFLGSGKPVDELMRKPTMLVALAISIIVLVPACYYLAKWLFRISFGKHLDALQENIRQLEAD